MAKTSKVNRNVWSRTEISVLFNSVESAVNARAGLVEAAKKLGRSVQACSYKYYMERRKRAAKASKNKLTGMDIGIGLIKTVVPVIKTIFVVFTHMNGQVDLKCTTLKKYAFNTDANLKPGMRLASDHYSGQMVVTDVLENQYKYYNKETGQLSNLLDSTSYRTIKMMRITDKEYDVVARIV